jgi:hypothetical protein
LIFYDGHFIPLSQVSQHVAVSFPFYSHLVRICLASRKQTQCYVLDIAGAILREARSGFSERHVFLGLHPGSLNRFVWVES